MTSSRFPLPGVWMGLAVAGLMGPCPAGSGLIVQAAGPSRASPAEEARTFYIAVDGSADNDGSRQHPWPSVEHALWKAGGGSTILVRPGVYRGPIVIGRAYAGTRERPTVVRSEVKWQAVIVGAPDHGISNGDGTDWCVVDGFEVLGARGDGIKMNGDHNVVRNCWVHNNGSMGIGMHERKGGTIEANLIEFNGCNVQLHHGVYASGEGLRVCRNVVRHNAAYGLHLYPSVKDSVVCNNLIYGQTSRGGLILVCPPGGGKNRVVNNTIAGNAGAIEVWNGDGEVIANNILTATSEPLVFDGKTRDVRADCNLFLPRSEHQGAGGLSGDPLFVDPARGAYWLRPGSPARGKGTRRFAPAEDFWGRPRPAGGPVDLGCFPFVASLAEPRARAAWHLGYAYRFTPSAGQDMPDLWMLPR